MDPTNDLDRNATVYDMRVEDMVSPVGIDDPMPTFSWKIASDTLGWAQRAYRILVKKGSDTVWDSGKVEKDTSVGIFYEGEALQDATEYTWSVTLWNHKDEVALSENATFEMGLLGKDAFKDAKWITYPDDSFDETVYTVDFDFIIDKNVQGFCFGMQSSGTFVMWQINAATDSRVLLRPHFKENGNWTAYPGGPGNVQAVDISAAVGYNAATVIGKKIHERIEVSGRVIKTYFGPDTEHLTLASTYTHSAEIPLGTVGFRHDGQSGYEVARYDNITVRDGAGNLLISDDFSSGEIDYIGNEAAVLEDGMLKIGGGGRSAEWILLRDASDGLPVYRRSLTPRADLMSAKLYTTALGVYETYINGQRVGRLYEDGHVEYHELKPGYTQPWKRVFYNAYDVTRLLKAGEENVISSVVTSGWWTGDVAANRGDRTAYLCKLLLQYADGRSEVVTTDMNWRTAHASPVSMGDIFHGEIYDARVDTSFMLPGFDDSHWERASLYTAFQGEITAWSGSFITVREDLQRDAEALSVYKGVTGARSGEYGKVNTLATYRDGDAICLGVGETLLVDFGQNFAGWEFFTVEGERGTALTVKHGEMLNDGNGATARGNDGPEGSIYNENYRSARSLTQYILKGEGKESYHPSFTFHGFRYIEIRADKPVTVYAVKGQVVTSVAGETGTLTTSDADVNQLVSNILWGMYSNYLSVPTDCPQRDERQGWAADTQVFAKTGIFFGDSKSFLMKFVEDMRDAQHDNGNYPTTAPRTRFDEPGTLGWADAGVIVPYYLYLMYGDTSVITEHWDSMERFMAFLETTGKWGGSTLHGDWLAYESNDEGQKRILGVSYYAWVARLMSEMAIAIGKDAEATEYLAVYEDEKAFYQQFVRPDGTLTRGEQSVCLYALYLDLLPNEESVKAVTKQLTDNIARNGNRLQTGFLGTAIIMPTLTKIGRSDLAYALLLQHDNPSWLYSVDQGATTIWERWNSYTLEKGFGDVGMNSFNHYAYGTVGAWMFESMAGINADPTAPGFKRVILAPQPDVRLSVNAAYESAYGKIEAASKVEGGVWTYTCTLPANTTGKVMIPAKVGAVLVGGKATGELTLSADGIQLLEEADGVLIFDAVAGSFTFTVTLS